LKHFLFEGPTIPVKPVRQLPHVFGTLTQLPRFKEEQRGAAVQFTMFNVDATPLITCVVVSGSPADRAFVKAESR
jgi:hypothetical protein